MSAPYLFGGPGEGVLQALLADLLHKPVGHLTLGIDGGQGLHEGLAAGLVPPAARVHVDRPSPISRSEPQPAQMLGGLETSA